MFILQQRKSMCRTVFLTILLEFIFVKKSISSGAICRRGNTRNISYFQVDIAKAKWTEAGTKCRSRNANLPVICNQEEQIALAAYLNENIGRSAAWTSGRKNPLNEYTWIDGRPFNSGDMIQRDQWHELYTHLTLNGVLRYGGEDPRNSVHYLCQYSLLYSGSSCRSPYVVNVTKGCVVPSNDSLPWYHARSQCLMNEGDLAILENNDMVTLNRSNNLNRAHRYWVGLRNTTWHWTASDSANEEVTYSNFSKDLSLSGECISIRGGAWMAVSCTDKKMVVCQTILDSAETTSSMPTSSSMKPSTPTTSIYAGLGAGMAIIIICIIVIIAVRCRMSHKQIDHSKDQRKSDQSVTDQFASSPANPTVSAPLKVPATEAEDMMGIYAEVSLSGLTQSQDVAKPQQTEQHGLVYASLEFQREPNNMEPDQKPSNISNPTKVGPMGDIYAMPDAKSHAVISPGNQSTSHPIKVAPQGDIYALPVKDAKPSATNAPVGRIYANM